MAGNKNSGRRKSLVVEASTQKILDDTAPVASKLLADHVRGKRKRLSTSLQRACEFVIEHAIGKARQKIEHSGGIMTYGQLLSRAEELETKSPELLINADKVSKN